MGTFAITHKADHRLTRIITPVSVQQSKEYCALKDFTTYPVDALAMWDTGAKLTCISYKLAAALKLIKVNSLELTSIHNRAFADVFLIDIMLPDNTAIGNIMAAAVDTGDEFDIIIGMNIISLGDFAITNDDGKTVFSFRLPASNLPIDFSKIEDMV
ncbi:MAG: aspartyl protease family protein [Treponema sp.]|jgi:hypothetical protein|nr:aspartyl protease family protein [Treponema sp.]